MCAPRTVVNITEEIRQNLCKKDGGLEHNIKGVTKQKVWRLSHCHFLPSSIEAPHLVPIYLLCIVCTEECTHRPSS